jgi:hypothetical protein
VAAFLQPKDARTRTGPGSGRQLTGNGLVTVFQHELDKLVLISVGVSAHLIRQDQVGVKSI